MALTILVLLWPLSEIALAVFRRSRPGPATRHDRGSMALLWIVIAAGVGFGWWLQFPGLGRIALPAGVLHAAAFVLLAAGLAVRGTAILTLGRFFTTDVAIHEGHDLVRAGLYRYVRHPSYSGMMLAFAGLGVAFGNWLSLAVVMLPILAALAYRIRVEEAALTEAFGDRYREYAATTRRLVPWVY